jgi:uncharacterized protein with HEPN domain
MSQPLYTFELFCIDPDDIRSEQALAKALVFSSNLWNNNEPKETQQRGRWHVTEEKSKITIRIKSVDTSKVLTDYIETAYIIQVECPDFDDTESFRHRLLHHLRNTLNFKYIRILVDDISTTIANHLYPEINKVESMLRRYLTKFFIQRVGMDWWEATATKTMIEKVKIRKGNKFVDFDDFVESDVNLADFDDLGELIYKQSSGFNNPDKVIQKLLDIGTLEDLQNLKSELQGNYTKYFKAFFQDKFFEPKWKELYRIRNKVAHHGTFFRSELDKGLNLSQDLMEIIETAENSIDEIVFSIEEKEAIRNATIEAINTSSTEEKNEPNKETEQSSNKLPGLKIVGKISLPGLGTRFSTRERVITEEQLVEELREAEANKYTTYIGLKWFVTTFLYNKGYSVSLSYSLVNILIDKNKIELYEITSNDGYPIRAIRVIEDEEDVD